MKTIKLFVFSVSLMISALSLAGNVTCKSNSVEAQADLCERMVASGQPVPRGCSCKRVDIVCKSTSVEIQADLCELKYKRTKTSPAGCSCQETTTSISK